ncbi:tyrosine-type recombinase/integrase [Salinibacter ruber]|uniref:tyrosine-type recombinase/integrase n=1 Tax=Salinibacter ruber TaxID=146919 RepID=UPI0013C3566D|nr:tyrosine-type recombinase/integrase [Salinibacter ruber]
MTIEDAERITELANEDRRPSTRRVYESKWSLFETFCDERGAETLPAGEELVAAYLSKRSEEVSLSTIRQDVAAIRWMHERYGAEDPTEGAGVSRVLDGINQTSSPEGGRGKKQAVLTKHVRAMVDALPLGEPEEGAGPAAIARHLRALRDRAIILVGYAGAFRRGELARIREEHITLNADGMEIFVPKAKTEPRTVGINFARTADFCPVRSLRGWTLAASIEEGPIFRAVPRSAEIAPDDQAEPITGKTVRNVIGDAAEAAGLDPDGVAGHSLRRGHLTQGALNGAELNRLMKQAGHADPRTTAEYVEDAKRMETNTSRDLGL